MKTLLLILLLSSSIEIPSSKVADSPGAELLHRSDSPNRGGAILPDTFLKYPSGAEISMLPIHSSSLSTVDGGPILRSSVFGLPSHINFGLVDSDQDIRVGMEGESFHSTPVPVSLSRNTPEVARKIPESQSLESHISHLTASPVSFLLSSQFSSFPIFDNSPKNDQEIKSRYLFLELDGGPVESNPKFLDHVSSSENLITSSDDSFAIEDWVFKDRTSHTAQSQILLYVQEDSKRDSSELRLVFLEQVIDENARAPKFQEVRETFRPGTLWDGAYGSRWARLAVPAKKPGYLSLFLNEKRVLDDFLTFPGDSVQVFLNLEKGEKTFVGPDHLLYELQDRIQQLILIHQKEKGIAIHTSQDEPLFPNSQVQEQFEASQEAFGPRVSLIQIDVEQMLKAWKIEMESGLYRKELDHLLAFYSGLIDAQILDFILQETLSAYYTKALTHLQTLARYSKGDEVLLEGILKELEEITGIVQSSVASLDLEARPEKKIEFYYSVVQLYAALSKNVAVEDFISSKVPRELRDLVLAKHIYKKLKLGTASPETLVAWSNLLEDGEIKEEVNSYIDRVLPGSDVTDFEFVDGEGKVFTLEDFKGKTILINTYFTGCSASAGFYKKVLSVLESKLANEDRFVLVSLSADRNPEKWIRGNESELYNSKSWIRLHTEGKGYSHQFFRNYLISAAPRPILIGADGKLVAITELHQDAETLSQLIYKTINPQTHD
ncbi:TlpA family protein disulfide reductase [Algoriphagus boritolerans]|nr:thioredoxin family protein [Algoriphagus boritolerans]